MRIFKNLLIVLFVAGITSVPANGQLVGTYFGPQISALGIGASAQVKLLQFSVSGEFGIIPVNSVNLNSDDINYAIQTNIRGGLVMLNFHPGVLGITVGGGLMFGGYRATGDAEDLLDEVDIGGGIYDASEIGNLLGEFDFGGPAPAFMIGRRSGGFNLGLGVALTGTPKVNLTATGALANDAQFIADLNEEVQSAQSELNILPVMPLVRIGWQFGFGI